MSERSYAASEQACENTDRHLWPQTSEDAYAPTLFVTANGEGIGINVGGSVYVKTLREWHRLAGGPISILTATGGDAVAGDARALADAIKSGELALIWCHPSGGFPALDASEDQLAFIESALRAVAGDVQAARTSREAFESFVKLAGFTDWTRHGDGYLKPLVDRLWRAWPGDAAQPKPDLRAAAERVCWFDWSGNDMDAVAAIDALRKAVMHSSTPREPLPPDWKQDQEETSRLPRPHRETP